MSAPALPSVSTQVISFLTSKVEDINASSDKISDALSTIFFGIDQYKFKNTGEIQDAINENQITTDTFVVLSGEQVADPGVVDTAGNLIEKYGNFIPA